MKKFLRDYSGLITCIVGVLVVAAFVVGLVWLLNWSMGSNTYQVPARVTDIGYAGITVEYEGKYGGTATARVDTNAAYAIGDTITIGVNGRSVWIEYPLSSRTEPIDSD